MKKDAIQVEKLTVADLPESMQAVAEAIGIPHALEVIRIMGGTWAYIPKYESVFRKQRDALIREEYTRHNCRELALRHDLSETQILNIIRAGTCKKTDEVQE